MGQVMAVCISEKKGTQKKGISEGHFIEDVYKRQQYERGIRSGGNQVSED